MWVYHLATCGLAAASGAAAMALNTVTSACEGIYLYFKVSLPTSSLSDSMKAEEAREAARDGSLELNDDLPFNVRPCGKVLFEFFEICRHSSDGYGGK